MEVAYKEYPGALSDLDVYKRQGVSSLDIVERIERLGTKAHYIPSFDDIETFILENCINGDVLITMGAGDIVKVGEKLLGR